MSVDAVEEVLKEISEDDSSLDLRNLKGMSADDRFFVAYILLYKIVQDERKYRKFLTLALIAVVSALAGFQVIGV